MEQHHRYPERVTSNYAEIYFDDYHCEYNEHGSEELSRDITPNDSTESVDWVSPSDLLIGKLDLKPPFTSKITRGKTHEGILKIGDEVLERERLRFMKYLSTLLYENDAAWTHILEHEKAIVEKKVKEIYQKIFITKSKIMMEEINKFYEKTLQDLENHMRAEIKNVLISAHARIVDDTNRQITEKLHKEKVILENVLHKRYLDEIRKIKHYYRLLLQNELYRNNKLVNQAIYERNDALTAFYKQIDAENITSTMYVMSLERKKCRIKQFFLENYQSIELAEKLKKIKEREDVIEAFKKKEKPNILDINKEWEEKIKKILQLFLKFISFGLKLLPEQSSFLLDFERMVILQLNELQKSPQTETSILLDADKYANMFKFEECIKEHVCDKEPFVIEGDQAESIPPRYDSRETLPSDVDLPTIRLQRQFLYAKCHKYEEIKSFLDSNVCKCRTRPLSPAAASLSSDSVKVEPSTVTTIESDSSLEPLLIDDIDRLHECPVRHCKTWVKKLSFPNLVSYLDFTEENYTNVKAILQIPPKHVKGPDILDPKKIAARELPFSATKELYRNVETQYSSQEDLYVPEMPCPCMDDMPIKENETRRIRSTKELDNIVMKRRISLERLLREKPSLLKMFTDESFDFVYHIK